MTSPLETHSKHYSHIGGPSADILDRLAVAELCKGWPGYRDNSEWMNYRALFTKDAHVWTTWSGPKHIDDFIKVSKEGKAAGAFISHRENGTSVELNPTTVRAVGKMKATITQRFKHTPHASTGEAPFLYDVDCDCRFLFFCLRDPAQGNEWKAQYVKLVYEKDKLVPIDGSKVPVFDAKVLDAMPDGYKYLGTAQATLGYKIDPTLATLNNEFWPKIYECMEKWLDGVDYPGLFWDHDGKVA